MRPRIRRAALAACLTLAACGPEREPAEPAPPAPGPVSVAPYEIALAPDAEMTKVSETLVRSGGELVDQPHLGGNSYVIRIPSDRVDAVRAVDGVASLEALAPARRYHAPAFADAGEQVTVVVDLFAGAGTEGEQAVTGAIREWGGTAVATADQTLRATIPTERLESLAALAAVRWIERR